MNKKEKVQWRRAARLWGLQLDYQDFQGKNVKASFETLQAALGLISQKPANESTLDLLIAMARERKIFRLLEPCYLQSKADWISLAVFFPESISQEDVRFSIRTEGGQFEDVFPVLEVSAKKYATSRGVYRRGVISVRRELPSGYHQFEFIKGNETVASTLLLRPPPPQADQEKSWGVFAPLYSLHSKKNWGTGDLGDLRKLQKKTKEWGGQFTGILPILASPHQEADAYSPYAPTSKLFWDEIYLDVESLLEEEPFEKLRKDVNRKTLRNLKHSRLVPYAEVFRAKKEVLSEMAKIFFESKSPAFEAFLKEKPWAMNYAVFRSQGDSEEKNFHLFVQFQMHRQLSRLKNDVDQGRIAGFYMDFPLGVRPDGFDSLHFKDIFIQGCSVGAPPDLLFRDGQNWGFNPLSGITLRERQYDYFILCLRHQMQFAKILRLDHVMGLQRMYIIPPGMQADQGIYLRYNAEEYFAILAIESQRHAVKVVGENLGTVSAAIQELLKRYQFLGMWVHIFEAGEHPGTAISKIESRNLACLNTHDLSPFQGFLEGKDLESFRKLGFLHEEEFLAERNARQKQVHTWTQELHVKKPEALLYRYLVALARSDVQLLLINVEDLWHETRAQNIPGTLREHPNWQRKLKYPLESWTEKPEVESFLKWINSLRQQRKSYGKPSDLGRPVSL